jgi:hypothetical protein
MAKKLSIVALLLIVISITGLLVTGLNVKPIELNVKSVQQSKTFQTDELQHIVIKADAVDVNVQVIESTDGSNKITLKGKIASNHNDMSMDSILIEDGKLNLDLTNTSNKKAWSFLKWNFSDITLFIVVTPETQVPDLKIDVKVGDITVDQGQTNTIDVIAKVGDVKIQQASDFKGRIDALTDVGDVRAPYSSGESNDVIKVRTDVGDITIKE